MVSVRTSISGVIVTLALAMAAVGASADSLPPQWIFFGDRGSMTSEEERAALSRVHEGLSERARARRAKVRGAPGVDVLDLPVAPDYVDEIRRRVGRVRVRSRWLNAVSVEGVSPAELAAIERLPFVASTRPVARSAREPLEIEAILEARVESRSALDYGECASQIVPIQVDQLHALGLSGAGVLVAIFDTGFVLDHVCFDSIDVHAAWDFVDDDPVVANEPGDDPGQHGHGTAVLSVLAGFDSGNLIGPAWGASFALGKTESIEIEAPVEEDYWIAAVEWADSLGADVVTSSLGYKDWYSWEDLDGDTAPITIAADLAVANGISVLTSAGNQGTQDWQFVLTPADGDSVIAVGAVDSLGIRAPFSSIGPTWDGRIKPDVCAMGQGTLFAVPGTEDTYARGGGTSFSCPLAAGVAALLLEARPDWGPIEVREVLRTTATQAEAPDNLIGWGIVQGADALDGSTAVPVVTADRGRRALAVSPNPSADLSRIAWGEEIADATVEIFDARGRLVRRLPARGELVSAVTWNGRDAAGRRLPTGVYFARLRSGDFEASARIVRLR